MRARQYKVQQYNDARFSGITCCTTHLACRPCIVMMYVFNVPTGTEWNKAEGSYHSTQPMLTVIDSCLVFYSMLWAHNEYQYSLCCLVLTFFVDDNDMPWVYYHYASCCLMCGCSHSTGELRCAIGHKHASASTNFEITAVHAQSWSCLTRVQNCQKSIRMFPYNNVRVQWQYGSVTFCQIFQNSLWSSKN